MMMTVFQSVIWLPARRRTDGDALRLQGFRHLTHQIDVQQAVFKFGLGHLQMLRRGEGQLELFAHQP